MTQRTRYFMVGSALVVMVGLCTGLVAYYNGSPLLGAQVASQEDLKFLPANTSAVAFAKVNAIMSSQFREKLRTVLPTGEARDQLLAETGIDIERDIDSVLAGFTDGEAGHSGLIVIVRGRINDGQIEALGIQHGGTVEQYRGTRMLLSPVHENRDTSAPVDGALAGHEPGRGGVAFLGSGVVALGEVAALKRAIDTAASGEAVTKNADLMRLVGEIENTGNAWIVGRFDSVSKQANLPAQIQSQMPAVQWFSVSANVNGGVAGLLRAETRDDVSAENLRDLIKGGLAAGRLMSGQDPRIDAMLSSLQLTGTGKTVAMTFTVPPAMLDMITGMAQGMHGTAPKETGQRVP
jgi:hypothetical protein